MKAKIAAKPELVQISTAYKQQSEGEKTIPRNKHVEVREEKPDTPEKAKWPGLISLRLDASVPGDDLQPLFVQR